MHEFSSAFLSSPSVVLSSLPSRTIVMEKPVLLYWLRRSQQCRLGSHNRHGLAVLAATHQTERIKHWCDMEIELEPLAGDLA